MVGVTDVTMIVDDVAKDGSADLTLTIDRIAFDRTTPQGAIKYDSADAAEPDGDAKALARALKPLIGMSFAFRMTARGEITDLELTPATKKRLDEAPGLLNTLGGKDNLKHIAPMVLLPKGAVAVGGTWREDVEFTEPLLGTRKMAIQYTYGGPKKRDGLSFDEIATTAEVSLQAPPKEGAVKLEIKKQTNTGTIRFDRAAGRLLEREEKDFTKAVAGVQGHPIETDTQSVVTVKLLPAKK
jgi:hypothetical protein